jgi:hypothetical protein
MSPIPVNGRAAPAPTAVGTPPAPVGTQSAPVQVVGVESGMQSTVQVVVVGTVSVVVGTVVVVGVSVVTGTSVVTGVSVTVSVVAGVVLSVVEPEVVVAVLAVVLDVLASSAIAGDAHMSMPTAARSTMDRFTVVLPSVVCPCGGAAEACMI